MSAWVRGNLLWKGRIFKKKSEIPQNDLTKPNIEGYDFENLPESVRLGIRLLLVCQKKLLNEPPAEHIDPIDGAELLKMETSV